MSPEEERKEEERPEESPDEHKDKLVDFWLGPIDAIRLDTFRLAFALCLLFFLVAWWGDAQEWLTPRGFHVSPEAMAATGRVPTLPVLPVAALPFFGVVLFGSTLSVVVGWRLPWTLGVCLACVVYVTFADTASSFTMNKLFIGTFAILLFAHRPVYWTLDSRPVAQVSAWPVRILQTTLLVQYFTAAWCKLVHGTWIQEPLTLWSQTQSYYRTDLASWLLRNLPAEYWAWIQHSALAFELLAPLLFVSRRWKIVGFVWGAGFHLVVAALMHQLIYFSLQMLAFYILFMDDETLHRLRRAGARWIRRRRDDETPAEA